jgi:hypothetical protein
VGDRHAEPGGQIELSGASCRASNAIIGPAGDDQCHQPQVPKVTGRSLYRPWGECHAGASEPATTIRLGHQVRRQEGNPMDLGTPTILIIVAIIIVAIVALFFVVNARLNRRSPELEDYPRKPDGADDVWWTGGGLES